MAKIEMDLSEYERIQENKKLLEKSLENERSLRDEITKLQKEKLEALESAKMKVIKIKRNETTEHILAPYSSRYDLSRLFNILKEYFAGIDTHYTGAILNEVVEGLFKKTTSHTIHDDEVTTHGLDEIKEELRIDIEKNINEDIKEKLERASKFQKEKSEILDNLSIATKKNTTLSKENENLIKVIEELEIKLKKTEISLEESTKLLENLSKIVSSFNRLTSYFKLQEIRKLLK